MELSEDKIRNMVKEQYGKITQSSGCGCNCCCGAGFDAFPAAKQVGNDIRMRFIIIS